ncbi:MAG: hypothetical protein JSW62_05815 [Thermoplasmatales archaeon]|nr:MAG: hypothetical protein JSW62_05815 [Thermoplasmatales archaeon]
MLITIPFATAVSPVTKTIEEKETSNSIQTLLSYYNLDMDRSTMGEFEQLLQNILAKKSLGNKNLVAELSADVEESFNALEEIGVKPGMTITEAMTIIDNNRGLLLPLKFNLLCSIKVRGWGRTIPFFWRVFQRAAYGRWILHGPVPTKWPAFVYINSPIMGNQYDYSDDTGCEHKGVLIGLIGKIRTEGRTSDIGWSFLYAVVDGFALYSRSTVPFTSSWSSSSIQSNQQSSLSSQLNTQQSTITSTPNSSPTNS